MLNDPRLELMVVAMVGFDGQVAQSLMAATPLNQSVSMIL